MISSPMKHIKKSKSICCADVGCLQFLQFLPPLVLPNICPRLFAVPPQVVLALTLPQALLHLLDSTMKYYEFVPLLMAVQSLLSVLYKVSLVVRQKTFQNFLNVYKNKCFQLLLPLIPLIK